MYYLKILKIIIKNSILEDLAYSTNNWGSILSVTVYIITNIFFINILFDNVKTIAGYTRDEILLFNLISQFWFFLIYGIFGYNIGLLIQSVNNGELDLLLTKPLPSLFYTIFKNLNFILLIRDFFPSALILILAINWNNLSFSLINLVIGTLISVIGISISIMIHIITTLPVFWLGSIQGFTDLIYTVEDGAGHSNLVFEAWNKFWQIFFTVIFPIGLSTAVAVSVMLGKSSASGMLLLSIIVFIIFGLLTKKLWNIAIKNYTSASS